ncbi:UDP-glycosyltransferase family, conserved site [Sesbania bispinosa]|nr:UDP-glycosyltransferase family, conserved site [Sesbania bispinosa]
MASQSHHLHFLLVPLMSQSHLIPFTEMAKLLAANGVTVTIVLTPLNAARFNKVIDQAKALNLKIQFQVLPFPCLEAGLPEGCENMDTIPSSEYQHLFFYASNMLQEPLEKWLSELETVPSCIISDICLPWTSNVATKFNIPRVVFHIVSCFTLLCSHNISHSKVHERVTSMSEPFVVPDLPDTMEFTKAQLPEAMKQDSKDWKQAIDEFKAAELSAQGILVNTFEELEIMYVRGYEKVARSLCRLQASQLKELALGLEASNHPFIWVIRKNDCSAELEKWLKEENFEERNKGRGFIIRGWAPQVQILSHPATGGFLSHCGWNSTLETISTGVPMITWPMFAEQFFNEKLIVKVLKIGLRIGVEVVMDHMEAEKVEKMLVKKEDVKKAIEQLMEQGGEGEQRRNRARVMKEIAHKAVENGGSSTSNCKSFIKHIVILYVWTRLVPEYVDGGRKIKLLLDHEAYLSFGEF